MSQQDIQNTKYAQYQHMHVLRWGSQMQSGRPFVGREYQWMDARLFSFIKSTKFKRDSAERVFMSILTVYLDEVTGPSHQVGVFQKKITRWELSIEAALPEDLRRIPAAVFATRIYPIKRRRWKQYWKSGFLDPSKCFQKLKNVAIHL